MKNSVLFLFVMTVSLFFVLCPANATDDYDLVFSQISVDCVKGVTLDYSFIGYLSDSATDAACLESTSYSITPLSGISQDSSSSVTDWMLY
jgi:hypothetical protein